MNYKQLFVAAFLCMSASPLFAQAPGTRAEIRMLAFNNNLEQEEVYAQDPAAPATAASVKSPIKSYLNHEFSTLQLMGRKIIFTSKPDRASMTREGETIGEVTLPDGMNSAILLFFPKSNPQDKALCRIMPIGDSKRAFPAGSYHATNLSPLNVRIILEEKNYDFKPGQTMLIENPPVREDHQIGMQTIAFKDNKWIPMASSIWSPPGKRRNVLLIYPDPRTGNVDLRAYDDIEPRNPTDGTPVVP